MLAIEDKAVSDKFRILLIDDEEVIRDSCTHILSKGDYAIQTAGDGNAGLRMMEEFKPDVVFVDLKMPGISGMEVLERINSLDKTIVTIVITGYATINSAVEAMKKGAYDFLPKPFGADEIRLITRRAIEKRTLLLDAIALRREKEIIRENFTSIVSHELKSPLLTVQQNLYVILDGMLGELNPELKNVLARMRSRIDSMLRLINTWVEMTSVDVTRLRESFKPVDIPSVISKALEMLQAQVMRDNVAVVMQGPVSVAPIDGDEGTLLEVFMNIIGNALKYSEKGGSVVVTIEDKNDELRVSVSDKGAGIEKEDIPFIFDDFYRGKLQSKSGDVGCGLGLAISRRIIKAHNGSIAVESERGKGSTFTVILAKGTGKPEANGNERIMRQFVM